MKTRYVILGVFAAAGAVGCNGLLGVGRLDGEPPKDADAAPDVSPGDGSSDAPEGAVLATDAAKDVSPSDGSFDASDAYEAASAAGTGPSCFPLPSGAVSWWRAEGTPADAVGPNNGTPTNVTYVTGVVGQAFHFAGNGDILAGAVGLPTGGADRTLEMWVRIAVSYAGPGYTEGFFLSYGAHGVPNGTYGLFVAAGGSSYVPQDSLSFSQWGGLLPSRPLSENEWHHVAATLANGTLALYLDGLAVTTEAGALQVTTGAGGSVVMGGLRPPLNGNTTPGWLTGDLDEATGYARALRPDEIQGIFAAGGLGKCP